MTIRVLPTPVADAIAAGEVVERPAAVVKELVENALDAGAHSISVEVRGAGRTLIRVVDDGVGIPPEELELAFQRHATSKLTEISDLEQIATLGFRGEALASVAAVAAVDCRSRGQQIRLRAGRVLEEGAAMPTPGTVLEVRDLFAVTPARLKFLKSEATENAACTKVVQAYALLHPEVRFSLQIEGRTTLQTNGVGGWSEAASAVLGAKVADELLVVEGEQIHGLVSEPRLSRGSRDGILLAVNRRPIASRSLSYALEECYLGSLERGRYPVAMLDLSIPLSEVDVNVHPTKREVRFRSEREVFAVLQKSVRPVLTGSRPYTLSTSYAASSEATSTPGNFHLSDLGRIEPHLPPSPLAELPVEPASFTPTNAPAAAILRPLGQVQDSYLIAESSEGVVVIDQ
ncbi:MAG: DNA mismatch repair endonuclease MutL, partial [Candidatus Dormibacteraceae bacterium]